MKKVFLLLGIASFTTASAQQKDVFDINRYLKKKNAEKSITIPKIKLGFQKPNIFQRNPDKISPGYSYSLPNGDKVYSSPAYHMPIVIPDMRQFNNMPNVVIVGRRPDIVSLAKIPNAAVPFTIPPMFD